MLSSNGFNMNGLCNWTELLASNKVGVEYFVDVLHCGLFEKHFLLGDRIACSLESVDDVRANVVWPRLAKGLRMLKHVAHLSSLDSPEPHERNPPHGFCCLHSIGQELFRLHGNIVINNHLSSFIEVNYWALIGPCRHRNDDEINFRTAIGQFRKVLLCNH